MRHYVPPAEWPRYLPHEHEWVTRSTLAALVDQVCRCGAREVLR